MDSRYPAQVRLPDPSHLRGHRWLVHLAWSENLDKELGMGSDEGLGPLLQLSRASRWLFNKFRKLHPGNHARDRALSCVY